MISALTNQNPLQPFLPPQPEKAEIVTTIRQTADTCTINVPHVPDDTESAQLLASVQQSLEDSAAEGISIHSGLDLSRVMSLLAE